MRKWNTMVTFNTQKSSRTKTTSQNRNNQPALRQHTTPECKVEHEYTHFAFHWLSLDDSRIQYTAKQVSIQKQLLHDDAIVEHRFLIHHTAKQNTEPKQLSRIETVNIDVTHRAMMQMSNSALAFSTGQNRFQNRKKTARIETTIQHWGNTLHHGAKVEHFFYIQHKTNKQQNQNSQPESKPPASTGATYNTMIMQSWTFSIRILPCIG